MVEPIKSCPDCNGELESGTIIDNTHGGSLVQRYAEATIPESEKKFMWFTETKFRNIRYVKTYRCKDCNRLFSYAADFTL